ncbi:MAG TPA: glycosyltransferase family 61 protein [Polyangia bacterium]
MWSALPLADIVRRRILKAEARSLFEVADRQWEIAPKQETTTPPAYCLPNQLDRIVDWIFSQGHPRQVVAGGTHAVHAATRAFLLKDAYLIDGVIYKGNATAYLHHRIKRVPQLDVEHVIDRGSVYSTFPGNRYFGQWLMDDCVTYPLAAAEGTPVSTAQPIARHSPGREGHTPGYEQRLGMRPSRLASAYFRELVIFDDVGQNESKRARWGALGQKLVAPLDVKPHPGVFIIRGGTGERRVLKNELEIAEHLRAKRGFRVVDVREADVATLIQTCAGAQTVVGVEGSHLIHGIVLLPEGGSVLTLQPPKRFCPILKDLTDRDRQNFGFVLGTPEGDDLVVDVTEVERTLDLFPAIRSGQ